MLRWSREFLWLALVAMVVVGGQRSSTSQDLDTPDVNRVQVIDGDTVAIHGRLLQLHGIDAPELGQVCHHRAIAQNCGLLATRALQKLVAMAPVPVRCTEVGTYRQIGSATCWVGARDLGLILVMDGYAVVTPDSPPDYVERQREARDIGLGLWHGAFAMPWDWRAAVAHGETAETDCNVKAVVGADGMRHFYVPFDEGYDDLVIDRERGDTILCSDEAAFSAGWTRGPRHGTSAPGSSQVLLRGNTFSTSFAQNEAP